jgi:Polyketide cyclase / dehydrase and lipid transport
MYRSRPGRTLRGVGGSPYVIDYSSQFRFPVTPDVLWAALGDNGHFETWWGWLTDLRVEGDGLQVGTVLTGVVTPPLPYRMQLRVVVVGCEPDELLEAEVHGDLEGYARLVLEPAGTETIAAVAWTVEMQQRSMRVAARVAAPVLRFGHDRVVEVTVAGFRRHLVAERGPGCTG